MASYNLKSTIRSALRKVWLYSPLRREALARGRISRGIYKCAICSELQGPKNIDVDHIEAATPPGGINKPEDFGLFIKRLLFIDVTGLRVVCKPCHKIKTYEERYGKPKKKTRKTKAATRARAKRLRPARTKRTGIR
jgi:hypothetical protein